MTHKSLSLSPAQKRLSDKSFEDEGAAGMSPCAPL